MIYLLNLWLQVTLTKPWISYLPITKELAFTLTQGVTLVGDKALQGKVPVVCLRLKDSVVSCRSGRMIFKFPQLLFFWNCLNFSALFNRSFVRHTLN